MSEFLEMNIFFFVTTIAVVVVASIAVFILWRVQRVLRNIEHISEQVALESDNVRQDLAALRSDIQRGKGRFKSLFSFLGKFSKWTSKDS